MQKVEYTTPEGIVFEGELHGEGEVYKRIDHTSNDIGKGIENIYNKTLLTSEYIPSQKYAVRHGFGLNGEYGDDFWNTFRTKKEAVNFACNL